MTPCPSDDVLGALVQQVLPDVESERVRLHIDECPSCAQAVVAAVRGGVLDTAVAPTLALGTPSYVHVEVSEPVAIGSKIGRYDVRALLGTGGMGRVYEAYDAELDRAIALKVLRPELAIAQTLTDRLVRESRLMAKVSHPAVITVYDVGRDGATVFIAMELIRGETLGAYLSRVRPDWRTIVELFERAGAGLAAAHRAGIVHRDFKPDNVLVERDGDAAARVVVTDFGIARATSIADDIERGIVGRRSDPHITSTGGAFGTPAYMAPEQLDGGGVDARADVFAFAVSLWEALFRVRPFPGDNLDQIRCAMLRAPQAPGRVPRGLVRALERGLAIDPDERWQDMQSFVRELMRQRGRLRRMKIAAGVASLVSVGVAGALLLAPAQEDPCERATIEYDAGGLRAAIADASVRELVATQLDQAVTAWRNTHRATCKADRHPAQQPTTTACLDARKLEITGLVTDMIADKGTQAEKLVVLIGDPAQCVEPAPSLLTAKVPADPTLRRKVTALRYRAFAAESARDRSEFKVALDDATRLVAESAGVWPFQHAEALYLLGTVQSMGGDSKLAAKTLKQAAAVAEAAHHDYIAANVWIQLVLRASFDEAAPQRGLEYATYAEAALDRLGRPAMPTCLFEYARGATLTALSRFPEAEVALRRAVELAETDKRASIVLPQAIQGLGFLYEQQGRYTDAIDMFRTALAKLPEHGSGSMSSAIIFRQRLAVNLSLLERAHEAEAIAREAVELAEKNLPPENLDRAIARGFLAEVMLKGEKLAEALAEARHAMRAVAALEGERSGRYGQMLMVEAETLHMLERFAESAKHYARACDIIAFHFGEDSADHANCELSHATTVMDWGRAREAFAIVQRVLPRVIATYGTDEHPQVANALLIHGVLQVELGGESDGIAMLERAVASFEKQSIDPGHLAAAQWALAKALWSRDTARARDLLDKSLARFKKASVSWAATHAEAAEWHASNGKPTRRR